MSVSGVLGSLGSLGSLGVLGVPLLSSLSPQPVNKKTPNTSVTASIPAKNRLFFVI
jgi:hypothetical protein